LISEAALVDRPEADATQTRKRLRIGRASGLRPYNDKFAVGIWYYTSTFSDLSDIDARGGPLEHRGSGGAYMVLDRLLYQAQEDSKQRVAAFVQAGIGDQQVNRFGAYVGLGFVASGLVPDRPADEFGAAVAIVRNGSHFMQLQERLGVATRASEVALEITYLAQINRWLAVQPNIQYIIRPDTDPTIKNALAFQVRFELGFREDCSP
jgi:porin